MTSSTKNHLDVVQRYVAAGGVSLKCYTVDNLSDRTLASGWLWLSRDDLQEMVKQVDHERNIAAQPMLPPWDSQPADSNVRWLPPQP